MLESGRQWIRNGLEPKALAELDQLVTNIGAGRRIQLNNKVLGALAPVTDLVSKTMNAARPVRLIAFDKSDDQNWSLDWHQDRVIAVKRREEVACFGKWTRKAGVWHCEAPESILSRMLFVRVHLDRTDASNGAMEIVPESHQSGVLSKDKSLDLSQSSTTEICSAERGDVLLLDMLTLHRSPPSTMKTSRRAIRVDYANFDLPSPLRWAPID